MPKIAQILGFDVFNMSECPVHGATPVDQWCLKPTVGHREKFLPWAGLAGSEFTSHYTPPESHHCLLLHLH